MPVRLWLERILYITAIAVACAIAAGTVLAFALGKAHPGAAVRERQPVPSEQAAVPAGVTGAPPITPQKGAQRTDKTHAYMSLGQIRAQVKQDSAQADPQVVVVSPWFLYPPNDAPFYEELSAKSRKLPIVVFDYFSRHTLKELLQKGETAVKGDIISLINAELTLGKIPELYFDEYLFFD
jgi:flagellar basal body-associated protein FliL